jgi:chemotaxis protein MotB
MSFEETSKHNDGEHENYFVSMTDMMVGMLFVFIILLMSFAFAFRQQTDVQLISTKEQKNKIEIAVDVGRKLDELESRIRRQLDEIREANQVRMRLLVEMKDRLAKERLIVEISPSGDVLRLTEQAVLFPPNESTLLGTAKDNVDKIARVMARVLPVYAICSKTKPVRGCRSQNQASVETVFIEGHTDETGPDDRNWILSAQRAASTYRELTAVAPELRGILNRRAEEIISISGYASTRRVDASGNAAAWEKNRRIDLRFVMDTDPRAGLEEASALLKVMRDAISDLRGVPR